MYISMHINRSCPPKLMPGRCVLLLQQPPAGRKLLVVGTTSVGTVMEDMGFGAAFDVRLHVPVLREPEIGAVLASLHAFPHEEVIGRLPFS